MERSYYRKRYSKKYIRIQREALAINILAASLLILTAIFIFNRFVFKKESKELRIDPLNAAYFQIPYKSYEDLEILCIKNELPFSDVLALFCVENKFFPDKSAVTPTDDLLKDFVADFRRKEALYKKSDLMPYYELLKNLYNEIKYFPLPFGYDGYSFSDSYGAKRDYGGERIHQGTDIMDTENIPGSIPVVSMTDGRVTQLGWNEKGGFRVGITGESGTYYYYAHFDSFEPGLKIGDFVNAGDRLGFMGDTGYSKVEGTGGNFPVHLHVGICPETELTKDEFWINPYIFLRAAEDTKIYF